MIKIPNYEIGKLAGRGGVAEVYLATHKLLDRTVAIKLISPTKSDELADKRFLKEAKVVAGLRQSNIISIYDVGILDGKYYIIMEYLEGGDLKQRIKQVLTVEQSLKILRQITLAIAHAHDKGFIHRDIKSQNIMFRADGTAVLTDFGIVKDLTVESGYTVDGTSIGTPHYMSPEQALGSGKIDWRTDLYSLGVTFYEMLTGSVPYFADSVIAVALKHINDPVPQLPERFARFQPIIDKLMAKKPEDRFQSAHYLLREIDKLEGKDFLSETIEQKVKPVQKINPVRILLAVLAVCFVSGVVFISHPYLIDLPVIKNLIDRQPPLNKLRNSGPRQINPPIQVAPLSSKPEIPIAEPVNIDLKDIINSELLSNAITTKNYSEALQHIEQTRNKLPESSNEILQKADNFLQSKQFINAGDMYCTVLSVNPDNISALLGLLYVAVDKQMELTGRNKTSITGHDTLLALLNKAIKISSYNLFKRLKIDTVESLYDSAEKEYKQQKLKKAYQWTKTGLKYAPDHLRLKKLSYRIRAKICLNENRLTLPKEDNALAYFRKILKLDPEDQDAKKGMLNIVDKYKIMAQAAQKNNNDTEAAQLIKRARSIDPDNKKLKIIEMMIAGDNGGSKQESAKFYLNALKLNPSHVKAKIKIEAIVRDLDKNGNTKKAMAILKQALSIAPKSPVLNKRLKSIDRYQEVIAKISKSLSQIKQNQSIKEKIALYKSFFTSLDSAIASYGKKKLANLNQDGITQIKKDIENQKSLSQSIPDEFINLVSTHLPELNEYVKNAQYDILIAKGDTAFTKQEMADFYLKALALIQNRTQAKKKIGLLALDLDANGKNSEAMAVVQQALAIAPNDSKFNKLVLSIKREIKIFVTPSGCGKENIIIFTAPIFAEKLNLCIQYRNLEPDSIVNIELGHDNTHSMEIPVVLNGRTGNKQVTIAAPVEGFMVGNYTILVKQKKKILTKSRIEFIPKRR